MHLLSQDKSSKDTGEGLVRHRGDGAVKPSLSTGVYSLDQALETHLSVCTVLLGVRNQSNQTIRQLATYIVTLHTVSFQALKCSDSDLVHKDVMEELSRQVDMLEKIATLSQRMIEEISVSECKYNIRVDL